MERADAKVAGEEPPPTDLSLDDESEDPEEHHVAHEMFDAGMGKKRGNPLRGMETIAVAKNPVLRILDLAGNHADEDESISDDQADRGDRQVINRRVGGER